MRELPLASLESDGLYRHGLKIEAGLEVPVERTEINGLGQTHRYHHVYHNEPGIIDVYTPSPAYLHEKGDQYISNVASYIMELLWGKVSPGSGVAESATILSVSRNRVSQLHRESKMPITVANLAATPVWLTVDVVELALLRSKSRL